MKIDKGFQLQKHNTFDIKCTASYYIDIACLEDAKKLSQDEYFRTLPILIKGGGSNLLFIGDFRGAVLHYSGSSVTTLEETNSEKIIRVGSGKIWHELVLETSREGLWGIENLALIPGEVGASAVQNIGAYGAEVADSIVAVHTIDLESGETRVWQNSECKYAYRYSTFKEKEQQFQLIYAVDFKLSKKPQPNLSYASLKHLEGEDTLTPLQIAEIVIGIREKKLPDPNVLPNAGSFFMNPIIDREHFTHLLLQHPDIPHYHLPNDQYKIPAAWLIEQSGLKGVREGNVGTYPRQPLVIVNYGGAYSYEVTDFAQKIIDKVHSQFGIELHPEVRYVRSGAQDNIGNIR